LYYRVQRAELCWLISMKWSSVNRVINLDFVLVINEKTLLSLHKLVEISKNADKSSWGLETGCYWIWWDWVWFQNSMSFSSKTIMLRSSWNQLRILYYKVYMVYGVNSNKQYKKYIVLLKFFYHKIVCI